MTVLYGPYSVCIKSGLGYSVICGELRIGMKKFLLCFASTIVATALSYAGSQLPGVPPQLKPWVVPVVFGLMVLTAVLLVIQGDSSPKSGIKGVKIKGHKNKVRAGQAPIEDAQIKGDENEVDTIGPQP
jgi:hypothetical protein